MRSKRLAAAVLGGALALGGAGMAAADSGHEGPPAASTESTNQAQSPGARMKAVFDTLVSDGTITQAQENKILAKLQAEFEAHKAEDPQHGREGGHQRPPRPGASQGARARGEATK